MNKDEQNLILPSENLFQFSRETKYMHTALSTSYVEGSVLNIYMDYLL